MKSIRDYRADFHVIEKYISRNYITISYNMIQHYNSETYTYQLYRKHPTVYIHNLEAHSYRNILHIQHIHQMECQVGDWRYICSRNYLKKPYVFTFLLK